MTKGEEKDILDDMEKYHFGKESVEKILDNLYEDNDNYSSYECLKAIIYYKYKYEKIKETNITLFEQLKNVLDYSVPKSKIDKKLQEIYLKQQEEDERLSDLGFDLGRRNYLTANEITANILESLLKEEDPEC